MKSKKTNGQKGFTLIELIVYLSLVSGILITATTFAWNIVNSRTKAFAIQEVESNGRLIMNTITQQVRQAQKISLPEPNQESSQLTLTMRDITADPTEIFLDTGRLLFRTGSSDAVTLSSDRVAVTSFRIISETQPGSTVSGVKVFLGLKHVNPERRQEWEAQDEFETFLLTHDQ